MIRDTTEPMMLYLQAFYRGVRSWQQDGKAERHLEWLNTIGPILIGKTLPIPTYYLEGNPELKHISSTTVRELAAKQDPIGHLVPTKCAAAVLQLYGKKTS